MKMFSQITLSRRQISKGKSYIVLVRQKGKKSFSNVKEEKRYLDVSTMTRAVSK